MVTCLRQVDENFEAHEEFTVLYTKLRRHLLILLLLFYLMYFVEWICQFLIVKDNAMTKLAT